MDISYLNCNISNDIFTNSSIEDNILGFDCNHNFISRMSPYSVEEFQTILMIDFPFEI
jgi:hypothetical protein